MSKKGRFIAVEGIDGSGKSTAIQVIVQELTDRGIPHQVTREPGGTPLSEALRQLLINPEFKDVMDARTELLLMYASRIQLVEQVIKPALLEGTWIVSDRFELSSFAYQGGGRGLDQQFIQDLSRFSLQGFSPDLTLYLRLNPEEALRRAGKRSQFDRIEQEGLSFFEKTRRAYEAWILKIPNGQILDASLDLPEVKLQIKGLIEQFLSTHS